MVGNHQNDYNRKGGGARPLLFILVSLVFCAAYRSAQAYELHFNAGTNAPCYACWTAPSCWGKQMAFMDGSYLILDRRRDGSRKWIPRYGTVACAVSNDVTDIGISEGAMRGTYRFVGGMLRSVSGSERADSNHVRELAKRLLLRARPIGFTETFWSAPPPMEKGGIWESDKVRWRLWFENPNEAGAFFAILAVLAFAGALALRGFWRVHLLFVTAFAIFSIIQTGSRGAVIGFLAAAGMMGLSRVWGRISFKKAIRGGLLLLGVGLIAALLFFHTRAVGQLLTLDLGQYVRMGAWAAVPRMMLAAPFGWWKPTGFCYCDWFQSMGFDYSLVYLVGTHQTIMVHGGYVVAFVYVFLWIAVLHALFKEARRGRPLGFGLWIALGVMMAFSTIGLYHWELWTLPVAALVFHLVHSIREGGIHVPHVGRDALFAVLVIGALAAVGVACELGRAEPFLVRKVTGGVEIGHGEAGVCVLDDGFVLSGGYGWRAGRGLRAYATEHPGMPTVRMADSWESLPASVDKLVLTGTRCVEYLQRKRGKKFCPAAKEIYFVSPRDLRAVWTLAAKSGDRMKVIVGSLTFDLTRKPGERPPWLTVVPGAAVYIPDWPRYIGL